MMTVGMDELLARQPGSRTRAMAPAEMGVDDEGRKERDGSIADRILKWW